MQSACLGGMEVSENNKIIDNHPLEQSTQMQHVGGTTLGNFFSFFGGLGLDATNSMLALSSQIMTWKEFQVVECPGVFIRSRRPPVIWCTHQAYTLNQGSKKSKNWVKEHTLNHQFFSCESPSFGNFQEPRSKGSFENIKRT